MEEYKPNSHKSKEEQKDLVPEKRVEKDVYKRQILGLSAAIAVLGVGCLAAGAGILAFSTGLRCV